jgi:hypothetical protein
MLSFPRGAWERGGCDALRRALLLTATFFTVFGTRTVPGYFLFGVTWTLS